MEISLHILLTKWLKKAKLRDSNHKVHFSDDGTFFYRGFILGVTDGDKVELKQVTWPVAQAITFELSIADPNFFTKLRKAFRLGMTRINAMSIHTTSPTLISRRNAILGGRRHPTTKQ